MKIENLKKIIMGFDKTSDKIAISTMTERQILLNKLRNLVLDTICEDEGEDEKTETKV